MAKQRRRGLDVGSDQTGPDTVTTDFSHGGLSEARWFISAPAGVQLGPLIDTLRKRGAHPYVLSDVARAGADLLQNVRDAIATADRVLVVINGESASLNSYFEAGFAVALGKPLLVLADPKVRLPSDFSTVLTTRTQPDDLEALNFTLDQLEKAGKPPPYGSPRVAVTGRPLGDFANDLLAQVANTSPLTERAAVELLTQAIETSGALPAQNPADRGIDLGVWSDDLDSIGANPLIVEVKRKFDVNAVEQVMTYLTQSRNARLALIVYLDTSVSSSNAQRLSPFPVLAISLQELLTRMHGSSFAEIIRQLRNASVHGVHKS
ncbi:hypothetical protein ACSHWB_38305 [Lentzea sp. HUAS TT2]|uniref:hypothetical protein n=1 Tax=Lentzea sp. HUAS TT2 TaxID=3447454 RepID=UPI003F6F95AC